MEIEVRAPAKLNLSLTVLARDTSGYHRIETLMCSLNLADELRIDHDDNGLSLVVDPPDTFEPWRLPPKDNLVIRAARAFFQAADLVPAARIRLEKHIPIGAGLGGGSSDAAATLMALNQLHNDPLEPHTLLDVAARLGSDVPFFISNASLALAWGRGARVLPLPPLPRISVLLAVPDTAVPTGEAYDALDARPDNTTDADVEPARIILPGDTASWIGVAASARNDFEPVIFERLPRLAEVREALVENGARFARLTGSGSALFGVFYDVDDRDAAAGPLSERFPRFRFMKLTTIGPREPVHR